MLIKGIYCCINNGLYLIWNKRNQNWNYFIASKIRSTLCKQLYHSFLMKEEVFIQISNMESQSKQSKIPRMVNWPQVMIWHSHVRLTGQYVKKWCITAATDSMIQDPFHMLIFHVFHKLTTHCKIKLSFTSQANTPYIFDTIIKLITICLMSQLKIVIRRN